MVRRSVNDAVIDDHGLLGSGDLDGEVICGVIPRMGTGNVESVERWRGDMMG